MEATGSGALLQRSPIGPRRPSGGADLIAPTRCAPKKEEKRRMKLVKELVKDLSALYSTAPGVEKDQISEADVLMAQLTKVRAEAKEMKKKRKQEKAATKAAKMKDCGSESSSSSESSDSECKTVVKMRGRRAAAVAAVPVTAVGIQEAMENLEWKKRAELT